MRWWSSPPPLCAQWATHRYNESDLCGSDSLCFSSINYPSLYYLASMTSVAGLREASNDT